ncbi:uncharacterized protein [Hoplias malabaricus]|uniref:uncharacterized protein isoform X2 n=1 Tax=Hoplias malabaricus TaxID=27720 RepID=UPI00346332AD
MAVHGGHVVVRVREHKTAAIQMSAFALTLQEEVWFDTYFTEVRPKTLAKKTKQEADWDEPERFFISSTGNKIYNASNDLERLHKKYNLPKVTSHMARQAFEAATKQMTEAQQSVVADYLIHSSSTAEKYRMTNVVEASLLLQGVCVSNSDSSGEKRSHRGSGSCLKMDKQQAYDLLVQSCPITVNDPPPMQSMRVSLTKKHQRYCYDRWRENQKQLRMQRVLDHFCRQKPSESRVRSWIKKQGWTTNIPDAALVVKQWKPSGTVEAAMDSHTLKKVIKTQKRKALVAVPVQYKGRSVLASRPFHNDNVRPILYSLRDRDVVN